MSVRILISVSFFLCVLADPARLKAEQCARDCHVCEKMAAPKLRAVHHHCPDCACARQLVNATLPTCPPAARKRFCVQGAAVDARGCPTGRCAATPVPVGRLVETLLRCPKLCAGGYHRDIPTGLPVCRCVCPLEETVPGARWQLCAKRCSGRRFNLHFNAASGCQECSCIGHPAPPCPDVRCAIHCPAGFQLDAMGCPTCRCLPTNRCPPPPQCKNECGPEGRMTDLDTGCVVSCECNDRRPPVCPTVGCNANCGPHDLVKNEDANGCLVGCHCRCAALQCPPEHGGVCMQRVRDEFGCPTCECAQSEGSRPEEDIPVCPESPALSSGLAENVCPNKCPELRLYDGERNCEQCQCCPSLQDKCPNLECEEYQTDQWGCPVCACVKARVDDTVELSEA